jgi:hypothetical protein
MTVNIGYLQKKTDAGFPFFPRKQQQKSDFLFSQENNNKNNNLNISRRQQNDKLNYSNK